ncbi:hypothetical protein Q7C36_005861 [Tachysurus vachellii]|uniref:Uncharacterized protein n=1 Tax=Tachysurus vachellii TaxID=175792 RepID=A0AA88NRB9_TACVA|nr:hypothetical protein Q7C36_005861 [Tachysurus vachellii]
MQLILHSTAVHVSSMSRNEPVCLSKVIYLGTEASVSCRLWLELLMFKEDRVRDWPRICLRNGFARMFPLLCLQDGQELANQSAGCISLLEIAVKNQLPDCAAVNHVIGRDVQNGGGAVTGVCLLRKSRCAEPVRFCLCLALCVSLELFHLELLLRRCNLQ